MPKNIGTLDLTLEDSEADEELLEREVIVPRYPFNVAENAKAIHRREQGQSQNTAGLTQPLPRSASPDMSTTPTGSITPREQQSSHQRNVKLGTSGTSLANYSEAFQDLLDQTLAANPQGPGFPHDFENANSAIASDIVEGLLLEPLDLRVSQVPTPSPSIFARKRHWMDSEMEDDDGGPLSGSDAEEETSQSESKELQESFNLQQSCIRCQQRGTKCLFTVASSTTSGSSTTLKRGACVECSQRHARCEWAQAVKDKAIVTGSQPTANSSRVERDHQNQLQVASARRCLEELIRKEERQAEEAQERIDSWNTLLDYLNAES